jgi:hypothetical protein
MSAKIIYNDVAPGADTDATVSASGASPKPNVALLPFGVVNPDFASLELNKWGGTGAVQIYDGEDVALLSTAVSGADCTFAVPPTITVNFSQNHTTMGISFRFASNSTDYPSSLALAWYRGTTLLDQKTFYPNATSYFCENTVTAFNKLVVTVNATNLPYRYARMEQIIFGIVREFEGHEIGSVDILQQSNLISAELAINTLDWSLRSKTNVDFIFQRKQPVMAYNGSNLIGVFYIDDKARRTSERNYEIPCTDAIGVLDGIPFTAAIYSNKNAALLMQEIAAGAFELDIDPAFASAVVTGLIPNGTKRSALQQVAFAIGAMVDTSGTAEIRVYPAPDALNVIPKSRVYVGGSVEQDSIVTAVIVTYHTYTAGSGTSGDDVITVGGVKYVHTTGTVWVDNPNVTSADKQNIKEVKEATLVNASNASAVAARVYAYYQRRNRINSKIVVNAEKPGDRVSLPTAWGDTLTGNIESMKIKLSNTTAADVEVKAVE